LLNLLDFGGVAFSVETVIHKNRYSHSHTPSCITGWKRPIGCLIFLGRFPETSPMIRGSFTERDLRVVALYASLPPCSLQPELTEIFIYTVLSLHSRTFSRIRAHSLAFSHILSHSRTFSRILAHSLAFSHILSHSRTFSRILAHSLTISHTHLTYALAFIKSSYCFYYCLFVSCFFNLFCLMILLLSLL